MREAAIYIVCSVLAVAFASFVSYSAGEDKWQRLALGAILLAMLIGGLKDAIGILSEDFAFPEYTGSVGSASEDAIRESFEGGIAALVADELSCERELVRVEAQGFRLESVSAEKITVYLYGEAALGDYKRVKSALKKSGFGECEVILSFEKNNV